MDYIKDVDKLTSVTEFNLGEYKWTPAPDDIKFYKPKKNDLRFTTYSLIFAGICIVVLIGYVIYLIYK